MQKRHADLVVHSVDILTMDDLGSVLHDAAVAVVDGRFASIGPKAEVLSAYDAREVVDGRGCVLLPGLVNTHTHLFQTFLKGLGRDCALFDWLEASIFPTLRFFDDESIAHAALVGMLESVRSGVTTVADYQYCHVKPGLDEAVIQAFHAMGLRGVVYSSFVDPGRFSPQRMPAYVEDFATWLDRVQLLVRRHAGDDDLVHVGMAAGIAWDLDADGWRSFASVARDLHARVSLHCLENDADNLWALEHHGMPLLSFLDSQGLLGPRFLGVHLVQAHDEDVALLAKSGSSVAHCPLANMILASGIAPVAALRRAGVNVSLATDGAASNDSQDMMEVVKIAALLQKVGTGDPRVASASDVLWMATRGGARALGMEQELGSIECGKRADFVLWNAMDCRSVPVHDLCASLVYASGRANVDSVAVNGRFILRGGRIETVDEPSILTRAAHLAAELVAKAMG